MKTRAEITIRALLLAAAALAAAGSSLLAQSTASKPEAPGDPVAELLTAAKEGEVKTIKRLLASGVKVDAKGEHNVTPLFVAALFGRADAAGLLIEKGADVKAAKGADGSTALHTAAFFCHAETVKLLLAKGADVNAVNQRSETPLDTVSASWSEGLGEFYAGVAKALDLKLDLKAVEAARPKIAALLRKRGGKTARKPAPTLKDIAARGIRCSYYKNGRIHVGVLGEPDGKPLTVPPGEGWEDFKPSWSKTGDMLVFFRRVKNDRNVVNWKTVLCVINADGTGLQKLTDGKGTNFNPTWTRDGKNTPIWNRKTPKGHFVVMKSKVGAKPGQEVAITDPAYHNWAYTCLEDGRILVQCMHPKQGWGYFLMTPKDGGTPRYQRLDCAGLERQGLLDRISLSPSETKVCFEHQLGHKHTPPGRALFVAGFDATKPAIINPKPFANSQRKNRWFAYPRWTKGEKAIVYHASPSLYLYTLADESTVQVSTDPRADYRYPHGERMPK